MILITQVYGNLQESNSNPTIPRRASNRTQAPFTRKGADQQYGFQVPRANSPPSIRTVKLRRYRSDLDDRRKPVIQGIQNKAFAPSHMNNFSNEVASRFTEEWLRVQRWVDFWVSIEELMEDVSWRIGAQI